MHYSVVNYKKLNDHDDWRWDGEFLCFEPRHNKSYVYKIIGDILKFSQYGISIDMNEEGNGNRIYRMNEISNMFCDRLVNKYADISKEQAKKFKLTDKDVLFNRTNSQVFVGRTGIFKKFSDDEIVFASYLIRVRPNEDEILPEYLTAFLNTKYGVQDAKRRARISINQSNINAEELKRVKIPILPMILQKKVRDIFNHSFSLVNKSESLYSQAEQLLSSELNLLNWKPKHRPSFVKNYSDTESAGRYDAEYFQPMYEEIESAIKGYCGGYSLIKDEFKQNKSTFKIYGQKEYKYVEIGSVNVSNGEIIPNKVRGLELPANAKRVFKKGDVIISKVRTYRGAITIVEKDGYVGSGAFTVLRENGQINKETLFAFLHSKPLLVWSLKPNTGTSYPVIIDEDILNMPIPILPVAKQKKIAETVNESFCNREFSKRLLDIAKRGVEMAIEKDEKTAEKWIDEEVKKTGVKLD